MQLIIEFRNKFWVRTVIVKTLKIDCHLINYTKINCTKEINYTPCKKFLNWQIERANYSKELVDSANGHVTKPFKLTLKTQESMSKEICNNLVEGKLSATMITL